MFGRDEVILKGENPWSTENWKKRRAERSSKQKFHEWLRDYCNEFHPEGHSAKTKLILENMEKENNGGEYNEEDDYFKPTLYLFLYNTYRKFRSWYPIFCLRMLSQKIFRKDHITDNEIWNIKGPLAVNTLKYLKAFKRSDRHGYPGVFSEYSENEYGDIEKYNKKIEEGTIFGGGPTEWEKVLDHIIMAFEYVVNEGDFKKESEWFKKYFGMDPYEDDVEVNKHVSYSYREIDSKKSVGSIMSSEKPDLDKCEWCTVSTSYHNIPLIMYAEYIVQLGLEEYGRFFQSLWD